MHGKVGKELRHDHLGIMLKRLLLAVHPSQIQMLERQPKIAVCPNLTSFLNVAHRNTFIWQKDGNVSKIKTLRIPQIDHSAMMHHSDRLPLGQENLAQILSSSMSVGMHTRQAPLPPWTMLAAISN